MKITIEPTEDRKPDSPESTHLKVEVTHESDMLDFWQTIELLIAPALQAYGFGEQLVQELYSPDE